MFQTVNGLPFLEGLPPGLPPFVFENPIHYIILDFSGISFTDTVGCKVLKQVRYLSLEITYVLYLRLTDTDKGHIEALNLNIYFYLPRTICWH